MHYVIAISVYLVVCALTIFIPAAEGYNTVWWKLLVGQLYALPIFIVVFSAVIIVKRKKQQNSGSEY